MNKIELLVKYKILDTYPYFNNRYHVVVLTENNGYYTIPFSKRLSLQYDTHKTLKIWECIIMTNTNGKYVCLTYDDNHKKESLLHYLANQSNEIKIGDRVHIHSRNGIYLVKAIYWYGIELITNKAYGFHKIVKHSDYKCKAGGFHNRRYD